MKVALKNAKQNDGDLRLADVKLTALGLERKKSIGKKSKKMKDEEQTWWGGTAPKVDTLHVDMTTEEYLQSLKQKPKAKKSWFGGKR